MNPFGLMAVSTELTASNCRCSFQFLRRAAGSPSQTLSGKPVVIQRNSAHRRVALTRAAPRSAARHAPDKHRRAEFGQAKVRAQAVAVDVAWPNMHLHTRASATAALSGKVPTRRVRRRLARTCVGRLFLSCEAATKVLASVVVPPPGGISLLIAAPRRSAAPTSVGSCANCRRKFVVI